MMTTVKQVLVDWMNDEEGASMVEYGLLVALIAGVCVAIVTQLGGAVNGTFAKIIPNLPK